MRIRLRTFFYALFFSSLMVSASSVQAGSTASSDNSAVFSASQIISEINAYRQASGSGALQYNGTLAGLAQNHSDFMASTGSITHDEGGTTPTDRAYAAGYGGGKKIILSEIIFGGTNADVNDAITWWKNSEIHNRVMLDSRYVEIGAGVSTAGDMTYFSAEIAFITGSAAPLACRQLIRRSRRLCGGRHRVRFRLLPSFQGYSASRWLPNSYCAERANVVDNRSSLCHKLTNRPRFE